jgi:hypothetical protein
LKQGILNLGGKIIGPLQCSRTTVVLVGFTVFSLFI